MVARRTPSGNQAMAVAAGGGGGSSLPGLAAEGISGPIPGTRVDKRNGGAATGLAGGEAGDSGNQYTSAWPAQDGGPWQGGRGCQYGGGGGGGYYGGGGGGMTPGGLCERDMANPPPSHCVYVTCRRGRRRGRRGIVSVHAGCPGLCGHRRPDARRRKSRHIGGRGGGGLGHVGQICGRGRRRRCLEDSSWMLRGCADIQTGILLDSIQIMCYV